MLRVEQEQTADGFTVCRLVGVLDAFTVGPFRQAFAELVSTDGLIIDMDGVLFVDSAGIGAVVEVTRRMRELGGEVVVSCSQPNLIRNFSVMALDRVVVLAPVVAEAKSALKHALGPGDCAQRRGVQGEQPPLDCAVRKMA